MFETKYRVICYDRFIFEVQFRYWWMPFYVPCNIVNMHTSIDSAMRYIDSEKLSGELGLDKKESKRLK